MDPFVRNLLSTLVALAFVLGLAWFSLRLLRGRLRGGERRGRAGADGDALHFVRALPVGTRERVVLIEHRGERWMLGVTPGGISVLGRWGEGDASPPIPSASLHSPPSTPPSTPPSPTSLDTTHHETPSA